VTTHIRIQPSGDAVTSASPKLVWPRDIYDVFKQVDITQIAYVPDAGHTQLIDDCHADTSMETVSLTSEQEGVAMLAGSWLGGKRGALLMQSSGVGNCINTLSIIQECRFPLLMVVTMRGEWGEFNPWQLPMGQGTRHALENAGVIVQRADRGDEVREVVFAAAHFKDWSK
jgi:sulfopyruvate decarboxylase TPP-binding subunit